MDSHTYIPSQEVFLVVEDNADDAILLRRAFAKAMVLNPVHIVRSAEDAIAYLTGLGVYKNRSLYPLPALILLDLQLPGMHGLDFLTWLREESPLRTVRLVVLSSSTDMRDVSEAYKRGANSFLTKPTDFDRFVEFSRALSGCWVWIGKEPKVLPAAIDPKENPALTNLPPDQVAQNIKKTAT